MDFRAAYLTYMADPCSRADFLQRSIDRIREERNSLTRLRLQARTLVDLLQHHPDRVDEILPLYRGLLGALHVEDTAADAAAAILEARLEAEDMSGGGNGE
jgi:hypothetical protein